MLKGKWNGWIFAAVEFLNDSNRASLGNENWP